MAVADAFSAPQYQGAFFLLGKNKTPFVALAGQNGFWSAPAFDYAMASTSSLAGGSQPDIDETDASSAPAGTVVTRNQDINTCQIYQAAIEVTYKRWSTPGAVLQNLSHDLRPAGPLSINDEKAFQIEMGLTQMAIDTEYTWLQGTYQIAANNSTSAQTKGIITGITTSVTTSGSGAANVVAKADVDATLLSMFNAGAPMDNIIAFVDGAQKIKLSNLYSSSMSLAPRDRNVGGVDITNIVTDFGTVGVVKDYQMPSGTILFADMAHVTPVFVAVPGKGNMFYEELAKVGAIEKGMLYSQHGIDYGPEEYHGKIISLS